MHAVENGAKGKARPKRSKSPQGGRFTPDPEPAPVVIRSTADLGAWLESFKTPSDEMANIVTQWEAVARDCLADPATMEGSPTQHWARYLLESVTRWRSADGGDPGEREHAAFCIGEAKALLWVYARDAAAQRVQQAKATQGKIASANPNMAELRKRMAAVPRTRLKDAPTVRLALEAAGWVSPWTERVTEARIREVIRSRMARKEECLATDVSDLIEAQHGACRS